MAKIGRPVDEEGYRNAVTVMANADTAVKDALRVIRERHKTMLRAARKELGKSEAEREKLERAIRDQQLELGRLKFRIVELETGIKKAERTVQQNTVNSRKPRGIGRRAVPYIPDGRKYP